VASGQNYTLTEADVSHVTYKWASRWNVILNTTNNDMVLENAAVYLNGAATTNGTGTRTSPFNNLADAIAKAPENGLIYVSGTVTISQEGYFTAPVIFCRNAGFTETMFSINVPNTNNTVNSVTMVGAVVNGGVYTGESETGIPQFAAGTGTLFSVSGGKLRLRGGTNLQNCATGVDISGSGELEMNYVSITATQYSVQHNGTAFTFYPSAGAAISGAIYLGTGKYISLGAAFACGITVACEAYEAGTVVVTGLDYTLTQADADKVEDSDEFYKIELVTSSNQLILSDN
jgi:hypothetical protein